MLNSSRTTLTLSRLACAAALLLAVRYSSAEDAPKPAPAKDTPAATSDKNVAPVKEEQAAREAFEKEYEAGIAALAEKNWTLVKLKMNNALKALGEKAHLRKSTAQILMSKADRLLIKDDALSTASELTRLKQWAEAEEAYRKVVDVFGETETLRNKVLDCRANLEKENPDLKKASELVKERKWQEAIDLLNKVSDKLGSIHMIRDGLATCQQGIEADGLLKRGPELLKDRKWEDAFNTYKRLMQLVGETDDVRKGIAAAQAGYAEERKPADKPLDKTLDKPLDTLETPKAEPKK